KGTTLVSKLLAKGYRVTVVDTMWFGNFLAPHDNLNVLKADIRFMDNVPLKDVEVIIHLASVANDPCGDLDPKLTWEISALATMQLADKAAKNNVKQFIYASSGSVYGIKEEDQVTEDLDLKPISEYNKTKMVAERVLLSYSDKMIVQVIRPATVCGYSPRMRLDVSVNMLTMQALTNGLITVFGGNQIRPNIHIDDITDIYLHLIDKKDSIQGVYNAGFENISILDIAKMVTKHVPSKITVMESNDPRSYRINSDKLLTTGFAPKKSVEDAIREICEKHNKGALKNEDRFHNLKWMQTTILK
ncbi:uncharacterized protein METZ01_LOCUS306199, partial [marine metagenome]